MPARRIIQEWYSPMEALKVVERHHGALAKGLIADKLRDGLLRARAEQVWESDHPTLNAAWRDRNNADIDVETDVEIGRAFWRASRHWAFDLESWRWPDNRFVVTRRKKPADRTIIVGLKLWSEDVHNIAKPPREPGGRKANFEGWANLFDQILMIERTHNLSKSKFPKQVDFQNHILNIFRDLQVPNAARLDDDTLKRAAAAIWKQIISVDRSPQG